MLQNLVSQVSLVNSVITWFIYLITVSTFTFETWSFLLSTVPLCCRQLPTAMPLNFDETLNMFERESSSEILNIRKIWPTLPKGSKRSLFHITLNIFVLNHFDRSHRFDLWGSRVIGFDLIRGVGMICGN